MQSPHRSVSKPDITRGRSAILKFAPVSFVSGVPESLSKHTTPRDTKQRGICEKTSSTSIAGNRMAQVRVKQADAKVSIGE
jgi:hypothetical protein